MYESIPNFLSFLYKPSVYVNIFQDICYFNFSSGKSERSEIGPQYRLPIDVDTHLILK